jgi:hypothetical protein
MLQTYFTLIVPGRARIHSGIHYNYIVACLFTLECYM